MPANAAAAGPTPAKTENIIAVLRDRHQIHAAYDFGPSPTELVCHLGRPGDLNYDGSTPPLLLVARDFNREDGGWEAVLEYSEAVQLPQPDGPGSLADAYAVAEWIHTCLIEADADAQTASRS